MNQEINNLNNIFRNGKKIKFFFINIYNLLNNIYRDRNKNIKKEKFWKEIDESFIMENDENFYIFERFKQILN